MILGGGKILSGGEGFCFGGGGGLVPRGGCSFGGRWWILGGGGKILSGGEGFCFWGGGGLVPRGGCSFGGSGGT